MTTIIYNSKSRYSYGWTNPAGVFGGLSGLIDGLGSKNLKLQNLKITKWTKEQLRCAWLIRFGSDWVSMKEIMECEDGDYIDVAKILFHSKQLATQNSISQFYPSYKLIPEPNENR